MRIHVTKYALTQGIEIHDVSDSAVNGERFFGKLGNDTFPQHLIAGREFSFDMESAIVVARSMRDRKIASLEKQLAKLRNMDFDYATGAIRK